MDLLSSVEVTNLEKNGKQLKSRFDRANDRTEKLLRRLTSARDELTKFRYPRYAQHITRFSAGFEPPNKKARDDFLKFYNRFSILRNRRNREKITHYRELRTVEIHILLLMEHRQNWTKCFFTYSLELRIIEIRYI